MAAPQAASLRGRRPGAARSRLRNRRGISLLEVVVALGILSVVLMSLSGIMWQMGRQSRISGAAAARTAAAESWASLAHAARWDSLTTLVGCAADTTAGLAYTRCYEVSSLSSALREVRVIIAPAAGISLTPETLLVQRTRPRQPSPFNLPP
jgi:hypothetical protein